MKAPPCRSTLAQRYFKLAGIFANIVVIGVILLGTGRCSPQAGKSVLYPRHYDLLAHFPEAEIQTDDPAFVKANELIFVAGEGRFSLFAHAPAQITFPDVPVYQDGRLTFGIGIHRDTWNQPGDGVTFALDVIDEAGQSHSLFKRHLDPANQVEDRNWFDQAIDLRPFAGQRIAIVLRTEAGANNLNDWAAWSAPQLTCWQHDEKAYPEHPNVILISIDTLRADHVSSYGYPRQTSPTLDRMAEEGARFTHAYSHSEHTNPSHLTMLTGLYPRSHGISNNHSTISPELVTIPERLQLQGYHTVAAVSVYHLGPALNMDQGFTDFYPCERERQVGAVTTDLAMEWLIEQRQEPFFMWVHYFDPHAIYDPPHPYGLLFDGQSTDAPYRLPIAELRQPANWPQRYGDWPAGVQDVAEVIAKYDGAIAYTDAQIKRLLLYLEEQGLADNTIVVVTSDHGEGFGEHGVAFDHYGLHEEMVHVPLIVWAPGRLPPGRVIEDLVGHVDLGPTLFELIGLAIPEDMPGTSLVPAMEGQRWKKHEEIVSQQHDDLSQAVRTTDWRLILQHQDHSIWPHYTLKAGELELYDLREATKEDNNLWPASSPAAQKALKRLSQQLLHWEAETPLPTFGDTSPLDQETEEMLRRLGY